MPTSNEEQSELKPMRHYKSDGVYGAFMLPILLLVMFFTMASMQAINACFPLSSPAASILAQCTVPRS